MRAAFCPRVHVTLTSLFHEVVGQSRVSNGLHASFIVFGFCRAVPPLTSWGCRLSERIKMPSGDSLIRRSETWTPVFLSFFNHHCGITIKCLFLLAITSIIIYMIIIIHIYYTAHDCFNAQLQLADASHWVWGDAIRDLQQQVCHYGSCLFRRGGLAPVVAVSRLLQPPSPASQVSTLQKQLGQKGALDNQEVRSCCVSGLHFLDRSLTILFSSWSKVKFLWVGPWLVQLTDPCGFVTAVISCKMDSPLHQICLQFSCRK